MGTRAYVFRVRSFDPLVIGEEKPGTQVGGRGLGVRGINDGELGQVREGLEEAVGLF